MRANQASMKAKIEGLPLFSCSDEHVCLARRQTHFQEKKPRQKKEGREKERRRSAQPPPRLFHPFDRYVTSNKIQAVVRMQKQTCLEEPRSRM